VDADVLKILTVCSHNRTRSVMSMAMLQAGFDRQFGAGRVAVRSLGFGPEGIPSIPDAVDAMRRRGRAVTDHRSRKVTAKRVEAADLILTSEKDHVIKIASVSPTAYRRTFTLPEFCDRIPSDPLADGRTLATWMTDLSEERRAGEYLRSEIPEVADPTGSPLRQFEAATVGIEAMCAEVVAVLSRSF
jgi:protein-tyrosine phosphatase